MANVAGIKIVRPLPYGRFVESLAKQLTDHILKTRPAVGDRFPSDQILARKSGLSRPTVRKALHILHRQGWLERRHGLGTFIGPRAAIGITVPTVQSSNGLRVLRLAVVCPAGGEWYTVPFVQALDAAASENALEIELIGLRDGDSPAVARHICQAHPDVVILIGDLAHQAAIIGEAARLEIPCITPGLDGHRFGLSGAAEDSRQGARLAVEHLRAAGHARIAIVLRFGGAPYVFERHEGYVEAMGAAGLSTDGLVLWIPDHSGEHPNAKRFPLRLFKFLERAKPTALISGTRILTEEIAQLVAVGELHVPEQLSLVAFHCEPGSCWKGGGQLTSISLPLRGLGKRMAAIVRQVADGKKVGINLLSCELVPGTSVRPLVEGAPET
jgi:DNA-binding LacI/PurR family transcriptional regulator